MLLNAFAFSTVLNCAARGEVVEMCRRWLQDCACCSRGLRCGRHDLLSVLATGLGRVAVLRSVRDRVAMQMRCCAIFASVRNGGCGEYSTLLDMTSIDSALR
jgi:hypothetical protein